MKASTTDTRLSTNTSKNIHLILDLTQDVVNFSKEVAQIPNQVPFTLETYIQNPVYKCEGFDY
jgi:hypothetical protein